MNIDPTAIGGAIVSIDARLAASIAHTSKEHGETRRALGVHIDRVNGQ